LLSLILALAAAAEPCTRGLLPMSSAPSSASAPAAAPAVLQSAADWVRYEAGNPEFRGRTTVELRGDGSVSASFQRGAKVDSYRSTLDAAALDGWRTLLQSSDLPTLKSQRSTPQPDEVRIRITLLAGSTPTEAELWSGEQWQIPKLRALVVAFSQLASSASGGAIRY
jgi:hypothetical protein